MGRSATWLNNNRPAIIAILNQIEDNALEEIGAQSRRHLTPFFNDLRFNVSRGKNGEARSVKAMRQAWFRWKTSSSQAATPPITDLALITKYAEQNRLLKGLKQKSCLELIEKLKIIHEEKRIKLRAATESTWNAKAQITANDLFDFLEVRISDHYLGKDHDVCPISLPDSRFVQEEIRVMINKLVEKLLSKLKDVRTIFDSDQDQESIYRPLNGWPYWMDQLANDISSLINVQADKYALLDLAYIDKLSEGGYIRARSVRRVLFPPGYGYGDEQSDHFDDPPPDFIDDDDWVPLT